MSLIPFEYPSEFYRLCEAAEKLVERYCGPRAWREYDLSGNYYLTFGMIADDHTTLVNPPTIQTVHAWVKDQIESIRREQWSPEQDQLDFMRDIQRISRVLQTWGVEFDHKDFMDWLFQSKADGLPEQIAERYVAERGNTGTRQ